VKLIQLDLNLQEFQEDLFSLPVEEAVRLFAVFRKIRKLTWEQLCRDHGLRWEAIKSQTSPRGDRLYSFRASKRVRVVAIREGDWMHLVSIHSDHDSAYQ
jgi:hypothetical protein